MKEFDKYVKDRTNIALATEHYEVNGNSDLATYNKSFFSLWSYSAKRLFIDILQIVKLSFNMIIIQLISLVVVIPTFPIIATIRAYNSRVGARNALMNSFNKRAKL